jgi:aminoglycoside phosphotransferase
MKTPKFKLKRWWKSSPAPLSSAPDHQLPQISRQNGSPSSQEFAAPIIEIPDLSVTYHDFWLLRIYVKFFEWLCHVGSTPFQKKVVEVCFPIPVIIKYGTHIQLSEASTLRFLAKHTSIPVPKVYCAFQRGEVKYIMMERVKGTNIGENWDRRPLFEKEKLLKQLKGYFEELRQVPHPRPGTICSINGGPLYDHRIDEDNVFGPFANGKAFADFLNHGGGRGQGGELDHFWGAEDSAETEIGIQRGIQEKENTRVCFTHGDAHSGNFLVRGVKVVAMIDFETSGFYPEYWEYTTAMTTAMNLKVFDDSRWKSEIGKFLKEYPRQLEMETLRRKFFAKVGLQGESRQG